MEVDNGEQKDQEREKRRVQIHCLLDGNVLLLIRRGEEGRRRKSFTTGVRERDALTMVE